MTKRPTKEAVVPAAEKAPLAPYPLIDRFPTIIGSNVSMATVSAAFRQCQTGYRQMYVDLLDELIERDPHAHAVISQRILTTAGGRLEIAPAKTKSETEAKRAAEIAQLVERRLEAIPGFGEVLAGLLWALYYGVAAAEISWSIDEDGWYPARLHFIHSRRLSYPDPKTWELHIWDQGMVAWWDSSNRDNTPTSKLFGIAIADYPGKFVVHSPQLRGDYPTRDGLGRELAYWMVLKGIAARGAGQYLERFGKPWVTGSFRTAEPGEEFGRSASDEDIAAANNAAAALGLGSIASAVLPDSVTLKIDHPAGGITQAEFIAICDGQMSKAALGQTMTTDVGKSGGNRALGEVQKEGSKELGRFDACCLADTLKRDLVSWLVRLNYPDEIHLTPQVAIHVNEKPDPLESMQVAQLAVNAGMPVDADDLAQRLGIKLVDPKNPNARRLFPIAPQKAPAEFDIDLARRAQEVAEEFPPPAADEGDEDEQEDADPDADADAENEDEDEDEADPAASPN